MMPREYDVPVRGGALHVGEWGPADGPVVVLVHGITASHRAWVPVARALPEVRFIAPDLRGRGRSNALGAPYGMTAHADDLEAMMSTLGIAGAPIVGHSMGAFVALVAHHLYPERFRGILLVDGGLPLDLPEGADVDTVVAASLGPAAERLSLTFPTAEAYLQFWRRHPALGPNWNDDVEQYARYDLQGEEPALRPATAFEAMAADSHELYESAIVDAALDALREFTLLTAPRGLLDETPGLYPPEAIERWRRRLPLGRFIEVPDVNHYTIVMGERGAATVAGHIRPLVGA